MDKNIENLKQRFRIMNYFNQIKRYLNKYGVILTLEKVVNFFYIRLFKSKKLMIYRADLQEFEKQKYIINTKYNYEIKKIVKLNQLDDVEIKSISENVDFDNLRYKYEQRFQKGAILWLIKYNTEIAGYGWTIVGNTIAPYFFPLGNKDVHFFDYLIFEQFRGKKLNPILLYHQLNYYKKNIYLFAYIETLDWNISEIKSLRKSPFKFIGKAKIMKIFNQVWTIWYE